MTKVSEQKPEIGIQVVGFNASWINEDFNPSGMLMCILDADGDWMIAFLCGLHDEWHTKNSNQEKNIGYLPIEPPTEWSYLLTPQTNK